MDGMIEFGAEEAVLGALMIGSSLERQRWAFEQCSQLTPEHFEKPVHRRLFAMLSSLNEQKVMCDAVTIMERIEAGGGANADASLALRLADETPGQANIAAYANIMITKFRRKKVADIALQLCDNPDDIDGAIRKLMQIDHVRQMQQITAKDAINSAISHMVKVFESGGTMSGVTTGFKALDEFTGGMQNGDLIIVGARPSMGKTAFLLSMMERAGIPRGLISSEQGHLQIGQRMIAMQGHVGLSKFRSAKMEEEDWPAVTAALRNADKTCHICDSAAITLKELVRTARKWKLDHNIGALYVDYLQRIRHGDPRMNKAERIGEVASGLKDVARELNIPVIALAQVKRDVEARANKRPSMGDLSDSSELEKEADQIALLYRDEIYNAQTPDRGICEVILDKNRHGPVGVMRVAFDAQYVRFRDL